MRHSPAQTLFLMLSLSKHERLGDACAYFKCPSRKPSSLVQASSDASRR
jgi:hypothetical protein